MSRVSKIICGDCLKVLPKLPKAKMIFADPPDNVGVKYRGFTDKFNNYWSWLSAVVNRGTHRSDIFWLSCPTKYAPVVDEFKAHTGPCRQFIWRYTFGQHNKYDCGRGYRALFRVVRHDAEIYPDAIRVPSARQLKYNDKRANPKGRVPDDVWEFPRVCGTFKERRKWFPNQHPEALIERIVKFSCRRGDLVIDIFAGSGTVNRVCKRLGIDCIGIEISPYYCKMIRRELKNVSTG